MAAGKVSLSNITAYPTNPQIDFSGGELANFWRFQSSNTSVGIRISFDGTNDHAIIVPSISQVAQFPRTETNRKVWLKMESGSVSTDVYWEGHDALGRRS